MMPHWLLFIRRIKRGKFPLLQRVDRQLVQFGIAGGLACTRMFGRTAPSGVTVKLNPHGADDPLLFRPGRVLRNHFVRDRAVIQGARDFKTFLRLLALAAGGGRRRQLLVQFRRGAGELPPMPEMELPRLEDPNMAG